MRGLQTLSATTLHSAFARNAGSKAFIDNHRREHEQTVSFERMTEGIGSRKHVAQLTLRRTVCGSHVQEGLLKKQVVSDLSSTIKTICLVSATFPFPDVCSAAEMGAQNVSWQIYAGFIASLIPFVIGASEFTKRILIQRRCATCNGSGLLEKSKGIFIKCTSCGGFFPWQGWGRFFIANTDPGNGGILRQPKGQTSVFYKVPPPPSETNTTADTVVDEEDELF